MNRCFTAPLTRRGAWACVALALLVTHGLASAATYLPRELPKASLRGELTLGNWPEATLGKLGVRMAPGARIKSAGNTLVMPNLITGTKLKVNYTVDLYGLVHEVWVLRPDELAQLWPETPEQASKWTFDPVTRTWTK